MNHVIFLFTYYLANLWRILSQYGEHKNKSDDNATPIKYFIVNKWVELALARQEIVVLRFLRAASDLSCARRRFLWEFWRNFDESAKHVMGRRPTDYVEQYKA